MHIFLPCLLCSLYHTGTRDFHMGWWIRVSTYCWLCVPTGNLGETMPPILPDCCNGNYYGQRAMHFFFLCYDKNSVISFLQTEREQISRRCQSCVGLVWECWCALSHSQHPLPAPRHAETKDQVLPLAPKAKKVLGASRQAWSIAELLPSPCCHPPATEQVTPNQGSVGWCATRPSNTRKALK